MIAPLVLGLLSGLNYGLLALGVVLVYKTNRFVNVAHAQLGVIASLVLAKLVIDANVPYGIALVVALGAAAAMAVAVEMLVVQRLQDRSAATLFIASVGVAQALLALAYLKWLQADSAALVRDGFPMPLDTQIDIGAVVLRGHHVLALVLAPTLAAVFAVVLRATTVGKLVRAFASNRDVARLSGVPVTRVSTGVWAAAGLLSGVTAILHAPNVSTFRGDALGPTLLLWVLAAAAIGRFTSLAYTFLAGVGIGLVEAIALDVAESGGVAQGVVFLLLLVTIGLTNMSSGQRLRDLRPAVVEVPLAISDRVRRRVVVLYRRPLLWAIGIFLGVLAPMVPPLRTAGNRFILVLVLLYALASLSLTVVVGWSGQFSLGQFALVGVGAFVAARIGMETVALPGLVLVVGAITALLATLLSLPAVRSRGFTMVVVTLGFAVVSVEWIFRGSMIGTSSSLVVDAAAVNGIGRLVSTSAVYYTALVVLVLALSALAALRNTDPGRRMWAVRDNEEAASAIGIPPARTRLTAMAIAGFLAGCTGVLWAVAWRSVTPQMFPAGASLLLLAAPAIGGLTSPAGAVVGSLVVFGLPLLLADTVRSWFSDTYGFALLLSGLGLVSTQLYYPAGIVGAGREVWQRVLDRLDREAAAVQLDDATPEQAPAAAWRPLDRPPSPDIVAATTGVALAFGGVVALDGVDMEIRRSEIVGLIGPNGAGKTTLLNIVSGLVRPDAGRVLLLGEDVTTWPPHRRSARGLSRSFQDARLFPGMTVREVVQVAFERYRVGSAPAMVGAPHVARLERQSRRDAEAILDRLGLFTARDLPVGALSTGMRRLCDLAMQIAARPAVLLLDEPTAGIAQREVEVFGGLIRDLRSELDCSIVVVEHDMPMLLGLADRVYALEAGRVISEGTPFEVRNDARVIAGYLGTETVAVERSGPVRGARNHGSRRTRPQRGARL